MIIHKSFIIASEMCFRHHLIYVCIASSILMNRFSLLVRMIGNEQWSSSCAGYTPSCIFTQSSIAISLNRTEEKEKHKWIYSFCPGHKSYRNIITMNGRSFSSTDFVALSIIIKPFIHPLTIRRWSLTLFENWEIDAYCMNKYCEYLIGQSLNENAKYFNSVSVTLR